MLILGTKRLVDFLAPEDYMYEQMVPIVLTSPIQSTLSALEEKIILKLSQLTMKDALFNPYDFVTEDMLYVDVD